MAARARKVPEIEPMLASLAAEPFHRAGWVFEEKYDGFRLMAFKQGRAVRLVTRNGRDRAADFPEVTNAIAALPAPTLVLDGEVVVFDRAGVSRFQLLQRRELEEPGTVQTMYVAFDCVFARGRDLRDEPLSERRRVLEDEVRGGAAKKAARTGEARGVLCVSRRLGTNGLKAFAEARRRGFEGIMAKHAGSTYESGRRSEQWLKVKVRPEDEFVIGGYTPPRGARTHFGALLLGVYEGDQLRYAGKVGTGYTAETLAALHARFQRLVRARSPFADDVPESDVTWLSPKLVGQFSYTELTRDGRVRQAAFLGLRDDKNPRDVHLPKPAHARRR